MSRFSLSRSIIIDAPLEKVFSTVQDFATWGHWSPWLCAEKDATVKVSGDGKHEGDTYFWSGEMVGEGILEHKKIVEYKIIDQEIRFTKPFKSTSRVYFTFEKVTDGTKVEWFLEGRLPFFLFFMKKMMLAMMGNDYERGLGMLKAYVEDGKVEMDTIINGVVDVPEATYLSITQDSSMKDMGSQMSQLFPRLMSIMGEKGIAPGGIPMSIYHKWDMVNGRARWSVAIPVESSIMWEDGEVTKGHRPSSKAFKVTHKGSYSYLGNSWMAGMQYVMKKKLKKSKTSYPFELYLNDPSKTQAKDLVTEIYFPLR